MTLTETMEGLANPAPLDLAFLAAVPGLTKAAAGEVLHKLAGRVPKTQCIVEIGVYKARSACYLAAGAQAGKGAHVWAVDPWDLPGERYPYHWKAERPSRFAFTLTETREEAEANVEASGLGDHLTLVRGFSAEVGKAWTGPNVGMLYVDGDHRLDAVRADWEAWRPHLARDAVLAFDDHVPTCADVMTVVAELVAAGSVTKPEMVTKRLAVSKLRRTQ